MSNNTKSTKEFDFSFLPPLPTAHDFTEKFRKENPKGNPDQLPLKIRSLLFDAFSMCENDQQAEFAHRLIADLNAGYYGEYQRAQSEQRKIKNRFKSASAIRGKTNGEIVDKLVYMKGKYLEGCYGFWECTVVRGKDYWGIRQPHKDNKFVTIGGKEGLEIVGKNIFEYHAALVGYTFLKYHRNPLKTIEKLNNNPEIKAQVVDVVIHIDSKTGELSQDKIEELIPLIKELWEETND